MEIQKDSNSKQPQSKKKFWIIIAVVMAVVILLIAVIVWGWSSFLEGFNNKGKTAVSDYSQTQTPLASETTPAPIATPTLQLEDYNGGFFSIKKPVGWDVTVGGDCSTFSFVIRDPANPASQLFYFGEIGPVYLSQNQKQVDQDYMNMGGYQIQWLEMPVVQPLTAENFLKTMAAISSTSFIQQFMATLPHLDNIEVISSQDETGAVPGDSKLIRALYKEDGNLGEGQFFLTTAELLPESGMPAGGIGYAFTLVGIGADRANFKYYEPTLNESINSFNISQDYVSNCIAQQDETTKKILKVGQTLSETSDIIMQGWENRNRSDDIISERRSDVMLGRDRVYDPSTGYVYDVENGWYDSYNINRQEFKMNNLERLPDNNWDLWTAPTKDANNID